MTPTVVEDPEELYRSIRSKSDEYAIVSGTPLFSVNAFKDKYRKPSVDRSAIRTNPIDAKKSATDGVAKVIAREVRAVCNIVVNPDKKGQGVKKYGVDVLHRPIIRGRLTIQHIVRSSAIPRSITVVDSESYRRR
jgi:hypothetical protein